MILTSWSRFIVFITLIIIGIVATIPNDTKMGMIYFKSYQYDKALDYFSRAKSDLQNSPAILKKMKEYFLIQGQVNKALIAQRKICDVLPKNKEHLQELAKLYNWNNMPYENLLTRERLAALLKDEEQLGAYFDIAQGYRWLRKYNDANRVAKYLDASENMGFLIKNLEYYFATKQIKNSIRLTNKILLKEPNNLKLRKYLAQTYELQDEFVKAIQSYMVYVSNNESYAKKIDTTSFLDIDPQTITTKMETIDAINELYLKLKRHAMVASINAKVFDKVPLEYDRGLDAAELYLKLDNFQAADVILKKAYNIRSAKRVHRAGLLYASVNMNELAIEYINKAIKMYPWVPVYYNDLTDLYEKTGQKRKALETQYKLLKIQKRKMNYHQPVFLSADEILVSDRTKRLPSNKIQQTQRKIIYLLYDLKDKEKLHQTLLNYYKQYPFDMEMIKMLAYSHLENNEKAKADPLFFKLFEMNPNDSDVALYVADSYIQDKKFFDAKNILLKIKDHQQTGVHNRLHGIHLATNNVNSFIDICQIYRDSRDLDYNIVEIQVRCNEKNKEYSQSIERLIYYLDSYPDERSARINLIYQYLLSGDHKMAKIEHLGLKDKLSQKQNDNILKFIEEVELDSKIASSWDHALNYNHYHSNNFESRVVDFMLARNVGKFTYGVQALNIETSAADDLGYYGLYLQYRPGSTYQFTVGLGKNQGENEDTRWNVKAGFYPNEKFYLGAEYTKNALAFDQTGFINSGDVLQDRLNFYSSYRYSYRNLFTANINENRYRISGSKAQYLTYGLDWDYYLQQTFGAGLFIQELRLISADKEIEDNFLNRSSLRGVSTFYEFKSFSNKLRNKTKLLLGADSYRKLDFGEFVRLTNETVLNWKKRKDLILNISWDKEGLVVDEDEIIRISLGYNFWFQ
jgi:tetratricopeptide (TPR) repeat protein